MALPIQYVAAAGAAPALAAMWYFDRLDSARPEPPALRRKVSIYGGLSVIPVLAIVLGLGAIVGSAAPPESTYGGALWSAFPEAAFPEELCKIMVVYWVVWKRPEFDERMDGIVYATRAGLGFALVENVMYLIGQHDFGGFIVTWFLRALLAVPGHALWTGMSGYFAARRRFDRVGPGLLGGYLLAVFFHGTYDASLFMTAPLKANGKESLALAMLSVPVVLTILSWIIIRRMARTALRLDDAQAAQQAAQVFA